MSGQQIGTVVGGVVGAFFGGYAGAQLGMAIGGTIGGIVDPTKINGPHIGDGQQQTSTDGAPIAWVMGTAKVAGTLAWVGPRTEVKVKDSGGKGGPQVSHYESRQSFAIVVCESSEIKGSTIDSVLMIEQDGKLVYDVRPDSKIVTDSQKWATNVQFYYGAEDQMPPTIIEADVGVGNSPAYRGVLLAVFNDFNIYAAGDRIPSFKFVVDSGSNSLQVHDFSIGSPNPVAITLNTDGSVQNTLTDVASGNYWNYPVSNSAYRLTADFVVVQTGGGDPLVIGLADAFGAHIMDFCARTEDKIDALQRPAVNYFASDFVADSRYVTASALQINVTYRIILTLGASSYTYTLLQNGNVIGSGSASLMSTNPPAQLIIARTGNVAAPAVEKVTYAEVTTQGVLTLDAVVRSISERGGLAASDIDVADLSQRSVVGYPVARACTGVDALQPLLQAYFAYGADYDGQLHFKFYGADAAVTVSRDDLIEGNDTNNGAITQDTRNQATEFPRRIVGSYMDPAQNYEVVNATAERSSGTVVAIGDQQLAIPVVMAANDAKQAVDKAMKVAYATLEGTRGYSVPFARSATYLTACPGEPVLMDGKRWVVDQIDVGGGYLKFSTRYDRQSAYTSNVQAITGNDPRTPTSVYSGPTTLVPMNIPALRVQDTYGIYLAAASAIGSPNWRGCNVQISYDGQQSWQNAVTITVGSTLGTITINEPVGGEPLTVDVGGTGDLESVTIDQLAANANAFALVSGDTTEIGQFQTATLNGDGTYGLTAITRGLHNTTVSPATAGQRFTMLDSVYFLPIDPGFAGKTLYLRGIGFGEVAENADIVSITYGALPPPDFLIYGRITTDGSARVTVDNEWRVFNQ